MPSKFVNGLGKGEKASSGDCLTILYKHGIFNDSRSQRNLRPNSWTKVSRVFLLAIHSYLYSFALRFIFLQTQATPYSFFRVQLLYTVKEKGGKPELKPYPLPYGLKNPKRNLRTVEIMPRNLNKIVIYEFGFRPA